MPHHHFGEDYTPACYISDRMLEGLWVKFVTLQRVRHEVMSDFDIASISPENAGQGDELVDRVFTPIDDELRRIAHQAATIESKSQLDMEYKAVMLDEFLPEGDRSLHVVLARSLVDDIRRSAS